MPDRKCLYQSVSGKGKVNFDGFSIFSVNWVHIYPSNLFFVVWWWIINKTLLAQEFIFVSLNVSLKLCMWMYDKGCCSSNLFNTKVLMNIRNWKFKLNEIPVLASLFSIKFHFGRSNFNRFPFWKVLILINFHFLLFKFQWISYYGNRHFWSVSSIGDYRNP